VKLWPTATNLSGLSQGFQRRSEGLVGECVRLEKEQRPSGRCAAFLDQNRSREVGRSA
jgi:hypothetical protein